MIIPSCGAVLALKSLQNAMMLTPCWPSAGPTGGAGFALPAGSCNLISPMTFFISSSAQAANPSRRLLDLGEVELDRRSAAENRNQHAHLLLLRLHLFDRSGEVRERAVVD